MALLAAATYDPSTAGTVGTTAAAAMADIDATNLVATFTAPSNGRVLCRLNVGLHGAITQPQILLGLRESTTLVARVAPMAFAWNALATMTKRCEALFVVPGVSAGSHTWKAAFGVETGVASTAIKHGGPNNTTTNDAFGASILEIWEALNCLGAVLYDPGTAVAKNGNSLTAMTAFDTTNARITFTAPSTGAVFWRIVCNYHGITTPGQPTLGILDGATVKARVTPLLSRPSGTVAATDFLTCEASGVITGLTPGNSYSFDAAWGCEIVTGTASTGFKYGGPNDTTANNAFGALQYEIWSA